MTEQARLSLLLKRYRAAAGLSQEALAGRAGLSARAISDLERGLHRIPHMATLDLLADALALSSHQRTLLLAAARPELAGAAPEPTHPGEHPYGLPAPPTALIGREREYEQALALLRGGVVRLVTLTGTSGVGKTRLALQVARDAATGYRDGAIFVDLSPVRDAANVPGTISDALQLREHASAPLDQQVSAHLRDKHILLLLDNFEQVIESGPFVADLLAWCHNVSCLVTSRTPLRIRGEQTLQLVPLSLEDAIILFRERAHAVRSGGVFAVSDAAAICERVDCLPLAIELAAGQVAMLSVTEVLEHLRQHLALVLEGARDFPARQRTIEAAIGWSYDLLTASQQRCFRALGVCVGGVTIKAACAICWESDSVTEAEAMVTLAALVDASLVHVEVAPGGLARLHMLQLVREYARARLRAEGEEEECRRRHATYFAVQAESLMSPGFGPSAGADVLAQELSNARAALEWAEEQHDAELGLRLAGFARLWDIRGVVGDAEHWLERMLALDAEARAMGAPSAPLALRVARLYGYARFLLNHGYLIKAADVAQESIRLAQRIDDQDGLTNAYATLGMIAQAHGDIGRATAAFTESIEHAGADARSEARYHALYCLADLARAQGDFDRAHGLFERALEGAESAGNEWDCAIITTLLGHVEREQRNNARARAHYLESLARFYAFGAPTFFAWCLEGYSALLCLENSFAPATRLCAAAASFRQQSHAPLPAAERLAFEQMLASARIALGEAIFDAEWETGSLLTEAMALAEAKRTRKKSR